MTIKRFDLLKVDCGYQGSDHVMEETDDGEYVSYELYSDAVFALTALVEEFNCLPGVQKTSVQECLEAARDFREAL